MMIIDKRSYLY